MSTPSTVIDNIGRLITNDSQFEVGATGELSDAWLVMVEHGVVSEQIAETFPLLGIEEAEVSRLDPCDRIDIGRR